MPKPTTPSIIFLKDEFGAEKVKGGYKVGYYLSFTVGNDVIRNKNSLEFKKLLLDILSNLENNFEDMLLAKREKICKIKKI